MSCQTRTAPSRLGTGIALTIAAVLTGCVTRTLDVQSDPPGALVLLNDREVGRTPFRRDFTWYGPYDVVVRKDGYRSLKTTADVIAPFWQWVPFDAITDFLPLHDEQPLRFKLVPDTVDNPASVLARGESFADQMESGAHTVRKDVLHVDPTTKPTTRPTPRPTTRPTTRP